MEMIYNWERPIFEVIKAKPVPMHNIFIYIFNNFSIYITQPMATDKHPSHNHFTINISPQQQIQISSNFDSGNLQSANLLSTSMVLENNQQIAVIKLELTPSAQPFNPQYSVRQSLKAFFHFNIKSNKKFKLHACIKRMAILSIIEGSFHEYYRLCVGTKKSSFQPPEYAKIVPQFMQLAKVGDDYILQFKHNIELNHKVYFAYHYPYSYEKLCHFLQDLDQSFKHSQEHNQNNGLMSGIRGIGIGQSNDIYYRNQLLIQSTEGRQINLITITQMSPLLKKNGFINLPREPRISKSLFPYFDIEDRPLKFNKPYVMITSRVHPGQTSASYALQGFIRMLISTSPEAQFLRKTFVFIIVPMINPDGVFHGTYRMDMQGHNLNRFYNGCAPHKHPAIFAISSLLQHHNEDLVAFFDIHSHPQAKGSFVYGNAYAALQDQVQSQVFAKLLSQNCQSFSYENCTFSQKNMNSKDINDILSKDGSARVCAYKKMLSSNLSNGIHCYALQLGYHGCLVKKDVNKNQQIFEFKSQYRRTTKQFDINDYLQNGVDIINTLAQVYIQTFRAYLSSVENGNQQNDTNNTQLLNCPLQSLRQQVSKQIYDKDERFRIMDGGLLKKIKVIQNIIFNNFYAKLMKKYPLILDNVKEFDKRKAKKEPVKVIKNTNIQNKPNLKVVHSLQLGKNQHLQYDGKKEIFQNEEQLRILRQKLPPKDLKHLIFRSNKQKINVVPVQFHIPTNKNSSQPKNSRKISYNKIFDMHADSLPRIEKKKFNLLAERHRLRQRRIQSSINAHNMNFNSNIHDHMMLPISRGGLQRKMFHKHTHNNHEKNTIDSNIQQIIEYENIMNNNIQVEDEEQYQKIFMQAAIEYQSNFNPQLNQNLNVVRNQAMFQRQNTQKQTIRRLQRNHQTQRITRRLETNQQRKRSKSRQKFVISNINMNPNLNLNFNLNQNQNVTQNSNQNQVTMNSYNISFNPKVLPKLSISSKTQKVRNRFDLQLKMKEKYDKQYKIQNNFRVQSKDPNKKIQN